MSLLFIAACAFILTRASAGIGYRLGFVDVPDTRKRHTGMVPLTGGVSLLLTLLACTFFIDTAPYSYSVLALTCAVFVVGLCGDIQHIRASTRLLLHYGCGLLLVWLGGLAIVNVGNLLGLGAIPLLALAAPLTALSVAGLCNAYNMIDGIDGLAAGAAMLPLLALYTLAVQAGHPMAAAVLPMLIGLAFFLLFNLGPNTRLLPKIFLGDSGSVSLGFLVTASLVLFSQGSDAVIEPVTALWLVALPLMDMLATMLKRLRRKQALMEADRSHVHHILQDMGLSARQALLVLLSWVVLCASAGLALEALPAYVSMACYLVLFAAHCLFVLKSQAITAQLMRLRRKRAGENNLQENA